MERREEIIRLWFGMWLEKKDLGIGDIFDPAAVYVESWGPEYRGREERALYWFIPAPAGTPAGSCPGR